MINVFVKGSGKVQLDDKDYRQGGEAKVYFKNGLAYKIYHDKKHMIPEAKLLELQKISLDNVCKPENLILDSSKNLIGFTMKQIDGLPISRLITTAFQKQNGITPKNIVDLVEHIKTSLLKLHDDGFLFVDLNPLNVFSDHTWVYSYFIDINSVQTPNFPATAISPHVRDYSTTKFSTLTDWYSFAIISCQLFVGIHPFRGNHPKYKRDEIEKRMKDGISIFNQDVHYSGAVRDLSLIPDKYMKWYMQVFENGKRIPPPDLPGLLSAVAIKVKHISGTDHFTIIRLREFKEEVRGCKTANGLFLVRTETHIHTEKESYRVSSGVHVVVTPIYSDLILCKVDNNEIKIAPVRQDLELYTPTIKCKDLLIADNNIYAVSDYDLVQLQIDELRKEKYTISIKNSMGILSNREVYNGLVFQLFCGQPYVIIPFKNRFHVKHLPELQDFRIIDMKHENHVLMATALNPSSKNYDKFIFRFNNDFDQYHTRVIENIDIHDINFTVLDNGIVISMNDDKMEVFSNSFKHGSVNEFDDKDIDSSLHLCHYGTQVRFFKGNAVFDITMKKGTK